MSDAGVFAIDRGIFDHPFFDKEPFTQREAWMWLIKEAAWKPHRRRVAGRMVSLLRGQVAASFRFMAERWRWSLGKVQRFIARLETDTMIKTAADTGVLVVTLCNYDKFQRVSLPSDTLTDTPIDTTPIQDRYKPENIKGIKEDISADEPQPTELPLGLEVSEELPSKPKKPSRKRAGADNPLFREFQNAYPSRAPHGNAWPEAEKAFRKAIEVAAKDGLQPEDLIAAARAFAQSRSAEIASGRSSPEFTPMAVKWLNRERWRDWLRKPSSPKPSGDPPSGWPPEIPVAPDRAYAMWRGNAWLANWGPRPGSPGCKIPPTVEREWIERRDREAGKLMKAA